MLNQTLQLPFTASFALNDPQDQLGILNDLIIKRLKEHAPMKRMRVTRQPAPGMRDLDIVSLKNDCRHLRYQCHETNKDDDWQSFRKCRNEPKSKIKSTKKSFYRKALSSKRHKEIWTTIHKILNPVKKRISFDPETLNNYDTTMAENLSGTKPSTKNKITQQINALSSSSNQDQFYLQKVKYNQVLHEIKSIRIDCFTGADNIPINLKIAEICPIPKTDIPLTSKDFRPISLLPVLPKDFERIIIIRVSRTSLYKYSVD